MVSLNVPNNLPISFYLLKQCKLWVWDFDDTLIDVDTYLKKDMNPQSILKRTDAELDIEVPQWRYFQKLVEFLVMHGRYVGIASFGTYEIIQAYMQRIMGFNQQFFNKRNIIAPLLQQRDIYRFNMPPNKNEYIYTLMRIYRVQDFKRVVLFDDNSSNIADAIAIGIVAIQIATPGNGDRPISSGGQMYFGPWLMDAFDKTIKNTCGAEIYQNRTYTGIASKENYTATAYDNKDINFGTSFREPYTLGVDDSKLYKTNSVAFGTGIGDRKVLGRSQFNWNSYKNKRTEIPKWYNGNYVNVPGLVQTDGYWDAENALGGTSMSFWDTHQKCITNKDTPGNTTSNDTVIGISEGFTSSNNNNNNIGNSISNSENNCGCKKFEWNWIILLLILFIVIMSVIAIKC